MEILIKAISDAGLGLGSLGLMAYLLIYQNQRQDKMNKAYIETLFAIQNSMKLLQDDSEKKWLIINDISKTVDSSAQALSTLKCLRK